MASETARLAAARAALDLVPEHATIGLGSGRAVFALVALLSDAFDGEPPVRAVTASDETARRARAAGIEVVDLTAETQLDAAFDGADEIDARLAMIKGGGAALLREKLVMAAAGRVVIMAEAHKQVDRLGTTRLLPVEVVRFGWTATRRRLLRIVEEATLRTDEAGDPVITDEGHHLLDVPMPTGDVGDIASSLKQVLGVVDHGLFIDMATDVLLGHDDGSVTSLQK
jgi:ribose 5-phosphate isomerase A